MGAAPRAGSATRLLCYVLLTGSCHWVLQHDPPSTSDLPRADLRAERALIDQPSPERRRDQRPDVPEPDRLRVDLTPSKDQKPKAPDQKSEQKPLDQKSEQKPLDQKLWPDIPCAILEAEPLASKTCPSASCRSGDDCDGLPPLRDPYPAPACNPVLFAESFTQAAWKTTWGRAYCSDSHEAILCGMMRFTITTPQTQAIWTETPVDSTQIVEVRFLPPTTPYHFKLNLSSQPVPTSDCYNWSVLAKDRICKLEASASSIILTSESVGTPASVTSAKPAAGWLVLQSFVKSGFHSCRLFSTTSKLADVTASALVMTPGKIVLIEVMNTQGSITFDLDWVRIFGPP